MKKMNSLSNRILALILCMVIVLGMFPANVAANESNNSYASVVALTEGVTVNGSPAQVQATFVGSLNWIAKDANVGRNQDGWWVGLRVNAPDTLDMERAKYTSGGTAKLYSENCDGDGSYIQLWGLVTEEYLRSANQTDGLSTYTWKFDWDGNESFEQTVILDIDADRTTLYNQEGKVAFPALAVGKGTVTGITASGTVSENGTDTTVVYADVKLNWAEKNPAAGRMQDGWWVGIQITAPTQLTKEADFKNVTYQRLDAGQWSVPKSFWDAQDSNTNVADTERYLTLWGMISPELIAADQDGVLTYSWRFDWNQDGLYEQTVDLKLNAETFKLVKDGIQQFPYRYGKAESLSGGTVTGSGTASSVVTVQGITLNWEEKNPVVGRNQDGWWAGAKITAPADMTKKADFSNVTYQRYEDGAWSAAKSFWKAQDSNANVADTERYLTLWGLVTPDLIAGDQDGILTYQWRFDWNQDGNYEQELSLKINSADLLLLDKDSVQVFPELGEVVALTNGNVTGSKTGTAVVMIENQELIWAAKDPDVGRMEDGWWTGIKVVAPKDAEISKIRYRRKTGTGYTDPMEYKPDDATQNALQLWGRVTAEYLKEFSAEGRKLNYVWEFDWDGNGEYEQTVTMTVAPEGIKLKQADFDFVQDADEITYAKDYEYEILKPVGGQSTQKPTYAVSDETVATVKGDKLIIKKAGEVTITATLGGEYYQDITASYTLNIKKADQPDFAFQNPPNKLTWQKEPLDALKVVNGLSSKNVVWSVEKESGVASVDSVTGKITLHKAGTFTLQAQKPGDDCYNPSAVIKVTIKVEPAEQIGFGYVDKDLIAKREDTVTFNDMDKNAEKGTAKKNEYTLRTEGGQTEGKVIYQVVDGDAATVDETSGVVTVLKAGTVKIKATKAGNDCYKKATDEFVLTIQKAQQSFTFENGTAVEVLYGTMECNNPVRFNGDYSETSVLNYTVSENDLGAAIDPATGEITFSDSEGKVGTVTVTAQKAGDDCYEPQTESYELTVSYLDFNGKMPAPVGDQSNEESGWFTDNVRILAPEGYTICDDNKLSANWGKEVSFDAEGADKTAVVYLKNAEGFITGTISVDGINTDTNSPDNLSINYKAPAISVMLEEMTFGIVKSKKLVANVVAEDETSGIDKLVVSVGNEEKVIEGNGAVRASGSFEIDTDLRHQLVLTAIDVAGRSTELKDECVLILDTTHPEIDAKYKYASNQHTEKDGIFYTQQGVDITFIMKETNFDLSGLDILNKEGEKTVVPSVQVNSVEQSVEWTRNAEGLWEGKITVETDGDYLVKVTYTDPAGNNLVYTDPAGNVMPEYSQQINISSKIPEIGVSFDNETVYNDEYYNADRTATITIEEHNFDAKKVSVAVSATDIFGDPVALAVDYAEYAQNPENWNSLGDTHTLELPVFDQEGRYVFTVDFSSLSGVSALQEINEFVIDKTAPTGIVITYEEPVISKIIETVTFGFYQADTVVTVTAMETASPVDYFLLSYEGDEDAAANSVESFEEKMLPAVQSEDSADTFSATYTLNAEARGAFTACAVNKANWTSDYATSQIDKIVVDTVGPKVYVEYTHDDQTTRTYRNGETGPKVDNAADADRIIYNGDVTATIKVKEANFFEGKTAGEKSDEIIHELVLSVTKIDDNGIKTVTEYLCEGAQQKVSGAGRQDITWTTEGDTHTLQIRFVEDGDYTVNVSYADFSGNEATMTDLDEINSEGEKYTSKIITVDKTAPVIEISYNDTEPLNENCYNADREPKITVMEHNFRAEEFTLDCEVLDILNDPVAILDPETNEQVDLVAYAQNPDNWNASGNAHTLKLPFTADGSYTYSVDYSDMAGNNDGERPAEGPFVIDKAAPTDVSISYSDHLVQKIIEGLTFGFYKAPMTVTVRANDITSGVDYFKLTYTRDDKATGYHLDSFVEPELKANPGKTNDAFVATYELPLEARGSFSVIVVDRAGNDAEYKDEKNVIVTDLNEPDVQVSFAGKDETKPSFRNELDETVTTVEQAATVYYTNDVTATVTVQEENFFEGKMAGENSDEIIQEVSLTVTKTDDNGKKTVYEYLCPGAQQMVEDAVRKDLVWVPKGDIHTFEIQFADDGDYVIDMSYADFSGNEAVINGEDGNQGIKNYTSKTITVDKTAPVIKISYDNNDALNGDCYKADRTATIEVTEHNFNCQDFKINDLNVANILGDTVEVENYQAKAHDPASWSSKGNTHILKLDFTVDGIYTYNVDYTDLAGNNDGERFEEKFTVDHKAPTDITISYSTSVVQKIIEGLTFGFYNAPMTVTVRANDITSGVDYFKLSYTRDEKATDYHLASFKDHILKAEHEPNKTNDAFVATYELPLEARGSFSVIAVDRAGNDAEYTDKQNVVITDLNKPGIQVDFEAKNAGTKVHFVDANVQDVDTFDRAANAFFNGNVIAKITIEDENFFEGKVAGENWDEIIHEVLLTVTRTDDDGNKTVTEYLYEGAKQKVAGAARKNIVWNTVGDTHTLEIEFAENGDYVINMSYVDFSENEAAINSNDGTQAKKNYTSKIITVDKTAPVINVEYSNTKVINTIDGRNYLDRVQSAVITVVEHNFRASDVAAAVLAKNYLRGDVAVTDYAAQLANAENWTRNGNVYTAKVNYTVDANYTFDLDMVDLALNASADYQPDLFTVDTTAPTNLSVSYSTSILNRSKESYYNAPVTVTISAVDATSGINRFVYSYSNAAGVSRVNAELLNQAIQAAEIRYDGSKAIATFRIPRSALGNDNQFNGTVSFTAYDRSENNTKLVDDTRIIVDNIGPTSTVTYNAPVQTVDGTAYYAGNINASIVINEANFDAADPVVTVTRNGAQYPVKVNWTNNSVDRHTGTFTLTEDGDYYVSVQYKDKSGNQMASYTSNKLTLDTQKPTVKVSNIKANSANKDEKYGFVLTVSDINLDAAAIKPVLKAVVQQENGTYDTVDIDLGQATVVKGETYTYTVENLPNDGLYTLTCEAKDMSANVMSQIVLDDEKSYEQVQFSINRNGSVFAYGNKFTSELVGQYYIYSVTEDIVIAEVNVDPIEQYKVTLNGKDLAEGTDYTTVQTSRDGEWSKRTYTIKKELFEQEGEYSIIVSSTDKTDTTVFSDVKNLSLSFVVDQTKPVLVITGLETGGRYQTEVQTVTLIPTDEGGRLNSLTIQVLSSNGNPLKDKETNEDISVRFEMSGEELLKYLEENDGKVTFTVPNGLNHQVKIICNDCALHEDDLTNEYSELFQRVTVSESWFVILFSNTPVFVGLVGGLLALIALLIVLISKSKKKKR